MKKINCEQLYNVWSTEPHLISILDLRDAGDFESARIPGARNVRADELLGAIAADRQKLHVIIHSQSLGPSEIASMGSLENVVFLSDCEDWQGRDYPLTGLGAEAKSVNKEGHALIYPFVDKERSDTGFLVLDGESKEAILVGQADAAEMGQILTQGDARLFYRIQWRGDRPVLCAEGEGQSQGCVLEDAQVLSLGDLPLCWFELSEGAWALIFDDKGIVVTKENTISAKAWADLARRAAAKFIYFYSEEDHRVMTRVIHGDISTSDKETKT